VKIGCQTGSNDSLKIHKGEQSTGVIHTANSSLTVILDSTLFLKLSVNYLYTLKKNGSKQYQIDTTCHFF